MLDFESWTEKEVSSLRGIRVTCESGLLMTTDDKGGSQFHLAGL
jgi:hypothetical protein